MKTKMCFLHNLQPLFAGCHKVVFHSSKSQTQCNLGARAAKTRDLKLLTIIYVVLLICPARRKQKGGK